MAAGAVLAQPRLQLLHAAGLTAVMGPQPDAATLNNYAAAYTAANFSGTAAANSALLQAITALGSNLRSIGWYDYVNSQSRISGTFLNNQIPDSQIQEIVNLSNSYGAPVVASEVQYYFSYSRSQMISTIQSTGMANVYGNYSAYMFSKLFTSGGLLQPQYENPTVDCYCIAILGIVCGLTGNEIGAAICAGSILRYCHGVF